MILKYKNKGAWIYKTIGDVTIAKVDISEAVSKYINIDTGKLDINNDNFHKAGEDVFKLIMNEIDIGGYGYSVNTLKEFMQSTYYVIVKEDYNEGNIIYINTEAYLMTNEGKTIERLF